VRTKTEHTLSIDNLVYLPSFAEYLLQNKLHQFVEIYLKTSKEMNIPLLKFFEGLPEEQAISISTELNRELLSLLSKNKARQQIEGSLKRWSSNQLPQFKKEDVTAEDITLISHLRNKVFLYFIPDLYQEIETAIEVIQELDLFLAEFETAMFNTYFELFKTKIDEHAHFIETITNTSPGIIYVFDVVNNKEVYANRSVVEFLGYTQIELTDIGSDFIERMIHPEDVPLIRQNDASFHTVGDGEIRSVKYRIRNKRGEYRWMRTYETVFRRDHRGRVLEKIGIAIDVHEQKITADELKKRETELTQTQEQYKRAETITHIGSYTWDLKTNEIKWSEELYRIYGLTPGEEISYNYLQTFTADEERAVVSTVLQGSIKNKKPFNFYYNITTKDGKQKILHARGELQFDENNNPVSVLGTAQDVTEKQTLLRKLEQTDELYRQAEALAKMGNYNYELETNTVEWTDQLYRIYDLEPQSEKISFERFLSFVHPQDKELVQKSLEQIYKNGSVDYSFRIITDKDAIKRVRSVAHLIKNAEGKPVRIIGTEQDITEKEDLLQKLHRSQSLYRQAEEMANMGNWSWDLLNNKLEWTDHLYRIYGLEPQSEEITIERFLDFVHPDDRDVVENGVDEIFSQKYLDYTFRIIATDGKIKTLRSVAQVHVDENGVPVEVVGTERDITEKQELISSLKESQQLYKQAQSLAHIGNWTWKIAENKIEWSDEVYRIYGLEPQSHIEFETYRSLLHPDDRDKMLEVVQNALRTNQSYEVYHKLLLRDGTVKIVQGRGEVILGADGQPVQLLGTVQDVTERQSLIEKLQESERLYKQAQAMAHIGNWSWNIQTGEVTWSEELFRIYDLDSTTALSYDIVANFVHPDDKEEVFSYLNECVATGKTYDRTHRIILQNGKVKTIHRRGEIIYDEEGNPLKMVGTTQDVTEEHRIQQELKENQTFIRKIADATPSIITSYNINTGQYVFVSEGLKKLLGYEPQTVIEKGIAFFLDIIHPDDIISISEKNARVLEEANNDPENNELVAEFTYRMKNSKGEYRWFHTYGTVFDRNSQSKVEHILNISLDVTEQVEATKTIKDQEHFIQQIADASPTILYLFDAEKQGFTYVNREIFFVLGYIPEELYEAEDKITQTLYHSEDYHLLPERKESSRKFQQADSMIQYECRLKTKDGEWRWVLVREIAFKTNANGKVTQVLGAALDINHRKEMERTLLQNSFMLEQSNASLEEFAYVASHDLKEPLRKISTFGDRLADSQEDKIDHTGKIYLKKIVDASQRMQTMIDDLLSISMISGNRSFEPCNLKTILEETLQTLEYKIEQQNAIVKADELPVMNIVPSQFRQLFQNLLSNSLKFVRDGVQPEINIGYHLLSLNEVEAYHLPHAEKYHKLQFSDNGIGFENEFAGKIFAIFQRLHGRSEYEGSGIGLAICKKIVEHHGGIIFANGEPEKGATFNIILPA